MIISVQRWENSRREGIGIRFKFMARLRSQGVATYVKENNQFKMSFLYVHVWYIHTKHLYIQTWFFQTNTVCPFLQLHVFSLIVIVAALWKM